MIVLYDADCGFCRWAMAWALGLAAAHVVREDGTRESGGPAAAEVLGALPRTRALARLARRLPAPTAALYGLVAEHRHGFGRFVGAEARRRADLLLEGESVTTAAELGRRTGCEGY